MGGTVWCACVGMILLLPSVPAAGAKAGDFYHTLGVDKGATAKEIKKAYRSMALKVLVAWSSDSSVPCRAVPCYG